MGTRKPGNTFSGAKNNAVGTRVAGAADTATQRFHATLDSLPLCIFECDSEGRCIYINKHWTKLTGLPQEAALGEAWSHAVHPDDRATVVNAWRGYIKGNTEFHLEFRFITPEEETHWVRALASPQRDERGGVTGHTGTVADIDDQKYHTQMLALALDRLNEAQRLAKVGSWELDLQQNILSWSNEIFRMFEIDPSLFGASYEAFLNAIHPEDRDAVNAAYSNSLKTRQPYEITHRLKMPNGRIKYVRETCTSYFDEAGKPLRSVGTVQDITELHKAELELQQHREHLEELVNARTAQLKESERQLRHAQQIARLGHWNWNFANNSIQCSPEVSRIYGLNEAAVQITIADLTNAVHKDDRARVQGWFDRRGATEELNFDHRIASSGGDIRWVHLDAIPLRDDRGYVIGMSGIAQDISARKRAEAEILAAKEVAEKANSAKNQFLSRMSHELRTPMNAIMGFAQVLDLELEEPAHKQYTQEIQNAGDHLLDLINELLDLSRIEAGKLNISPRAIQVSQAVDEALKLAHGQIQKNRITVQSEITADRYVIADTLRLKQILVNLLSNAAKYNREGGSIRVLCEIPRQDRVRIGVQDTGMGIAEEKRSRLFVPFERLGAEYTGVDGTGVGLALSKQLAELMNGDITVDTQPGIGSTFWVELPMAKSSDKPNTPMTFHARATSERHTQNKTILYIEDNTANIRVVEAMFRTRPDFRLMTSQDGKQGIQIAVEKRPDLILLDIHLPHMDGFAVLEQLKINPATRAIPVVALTADAMPDEIDRGLRAGFKEYLTKPIRTDSLFATLDRLTADRAKNAGE